MVQFPSLVSMVPRQRSVAKRGPPPHLGRARGSGPEPTPSAPVPGEMHRPVAGRSRRRKKTGRVALCDTATLDQPALLDCSVRPQRQRPIGSSCTGQSGSCWPSRTHAGHLHKAPFRMASGDTVRWARWVVMSASQHRPCQLDRQRREPQTTNGASSRRRSEGYCFRAITFAGGAEPAASWPGRPWPELRRGSRASCR